MGTRCDYQFAEDQAWPRVSDDRKFCSSPYEKLVRAKCTVIWVVIFLDETEDLVRIYDREWQCHAEENSPTPVAPGIVSPFPPLVTSPEGLRVSASPNASSALPNRHSRVTAVDTSVSHHKRRKTVETFNDFGFSSLSSPVVERSDFVAQYSPTTSHQSATFPISPSSVRYAPTSAGNVQQAATFDSQQQIDADEVDVDASYAISSEVQSPTYLELPAWPLTDIREARLMRYFVDHLSTWVSPNKAIETA